MLRCSACTRRALSIFIESALPPETSRVTLRKCISTKVSPAAKSYTTGAVAVKEIRPKHVAPLENDEGSRRPRHTVSKSTETAVNKQLKYLVDPFHIANEVVKILSKDRFEEAALLVRKASKGRQVPVSWNHLIDYQMRNQRLHAAIKLYNEMKKRGQLPTAQTYTVIFRGCANSQHSKLAVTEAAKLYNNMISSGRLTPNTVHMNAVLQVCARAEDIETLFTVVKSAEGPSRKPNNLTYTTIFNALRAKVSKARPQDESEVAWSRRMEEEKTQTIQRAKAIWDEVMSHWRAATLVVDEELVCSMGRILLLGNFFDNNDVFSLIDQTMGIPMEPEKLSILAWKGVKGDRAPATESSTPESASSVPPVATEKPIISPGTLAKPGNNTLSLIMSAIQNTGKANLARRYWLILTKNHGVVPDAENWTSLLRALRRGKSSTKTAEYMAEIPTAYRTPKVYRTAMSTCLRDNLNKSAFTNATRILETMLTTGRVPDAEALRIYLRVAHANRRLFEEMAATKGPAAAKLAWGRQICVALENLWEPYWIVAKQLSFGGLSAPVPDKKFVDEAEREAWLKEAALRAELAALARKMIAAHDRLIFDNMVLPEVAKRIARRRNRLNQFVVKYFEDRERIEPSWHRKVMELEAKKEQDEEPWDTRGIESS